MTVTEGALPVTGSTLANSTTPLLVDPGQGERDESCRSLGFATRPDRISWMGCVGPTRILLLSMRRLSLPAWSLAALAAIPPFVWWLGWSPGFASSDTIDQWRQLTTEQYFNHHPAIHTFLMDVMSLDGAQPGLVTLMQVVAFGLLMAYGAKWLVAAGAPAWLAVGAAWLLGISPAIAPTTISLWKDVPFGLFFLWAWIELLALAVDSARASRWAPAVRLGLALAGVALFRANGILTVLPMLALLVWFQRKSLGFAVRTAGIAIVAWLLTTVPLYSLLDVQGSSIEPATVFLPEIAAAYASAPDSFSNEETQLLEAVAPISVWTGSYNCYDSTPLVFNPEFDASVVTRDPDPYRRLEIQVLLRDPGSVIEHRWCAANFLYSPPQPEDAYFHRPEYEIPPNDVGLVRDAISREAFDVTDTVWRWAEPNGLLWLTWRPAIVLIPSLGLLAAAALLKPARRYLLPGSLFLLHLVNLAATSPAQEFRYAYPLYMTGVLTLVLAWPVFTSPTTEEAP